MPEKLEWQVVGTIGGKVEIMEYMRGKAGKVAREQKVKDFAAMENILDFPCSGIEKPLKAWKQESEMFCFLTKYHLAGM